MGNTHPLGKFRSSMFSRSNTEIPKIPEFQKICFVATFGGYFCYPAHKQWFTFSLYNRVFKTKSMQFAFWRDEHCLHWTNKYVSLQNDSAETERFSGSCSQIKDASCFVRVGRESHALYRPHSEFARFLQGTEIHFNFCNFYSGISKKKNTARSTIYTKAVKAISNQNRDTNYRLNVEIGEGSTEKVGFEFSTESGQRMERCNVIRQIVPDLRTSYYWYYYYYYWKVLGLH
jgi:hypothetical protein